jgi:TfoX/Sxy family transcriptional regulator of competence genes
VVCILLDFICVCLFLMQVTKLSPEETESTTGGYGLFKEIVIFGLVCSKRL